MIDGAALDPATFATCKPVNTLNFVCKCGCDMFRVEVDVFADGSFAKALLCVGCQTPCVVTEPMTNGPH